MVYLFQRTEVWTLTGLGWAIIAIALSVGFCLGCWWMYPFLTVSRPSPDAKVAVVEGWLPDDVLKTLISDLQDYQVVLTTGYPVTYGRYLSGYDNFSKVAADTLIWFGLLPETVIPIPSARVERNRTFASAIAVREWLLQNHPDVKVINLYSMGPHARRSWLIFRRALQPIEVGVCAAEPSDYEPHRWWQTSSGTRSVLAEAISLLYALLVTWTR